MADLIFESIYPLTITRDRYSGVYSNGEYIAWNLDAWEVPQEPFGNDVDSLVFWGSDHTVCGVGDTVEAAVADLYIKLKASIDGERREENAAD